MHSTMQSLSPSPATLSSPFLSPGSPGGGLRSSRSTRSLRSLSSASTHSATSFTSSSSSEPAIISHSAPLPASFYPSSLDCVLARARNASFASLASVGLQSIRSERRPSCFSVLDAREERSLYGDRLVGLVEPRDSVVGYWSLGEVLGGEA